MTKLSINKWDESDRPREKLMKLGAEALSKSELLAILIGSGSADESAVELMRRIMYDCHDSMSELSRISLDTLRQYKGIGTAKAVTIKAACELGKIMQAEPVQEKQAFNEPRLVRDYFSPRLSNKTNEECWVMLLNQKLRLIRAEQISKGGITEASVDIRRAESSVAGASARNNTRAQSPVGFSAPEPRRRPPDKQPCRGRVGNEHKTVGPRDNRRRNELLQLRRKRKNISSPTNEHTYKNNRKAMTNEETKLKTEERIVEVLKTVYDPEIPVNIYDLGLIYKIDLKDDGTLDIDMTLTAPNCPAADFIVEDVRQRVEGVEGVKQSNINLVFDPVWDQSMMSDEAKLDLGFM